jgi:hypothetical protein
MGTSQPPGLSRRLRHPPSGPWSLAPQADTPCHTEHSGSRRLRDRYATSLNTQHVHCLSEVGREPSVAVNGVGGR